jgi:hypothetical protein
MRRPVKVLCTVVTVGVVTAAGVPAASASPVACGASITEDVVLERSLTGCDAGLVVAADGITIDLAGHAIAGTGTAGSVGIQAQGRTGVTVEGGTIRGFDQGVELADTTDTSVERIVVTGATDTGISLLRAQGAAITRSVVTGSGTGIRALFGDALIEGNVAARNDLGIVAAFGEGAIRRNVASGNEREGVSVVRFSATGGVERNVATHNGGTGIRSEDSHGHYTANVVSHNGGDGMRVFDLLPDHGRFFTVDRNVALANAGVGLAVPPGTIDGGRNRAHANGGPEQCINLVCG